MNTQVSGLVVHLAPSGRLEPVLGALRDRATFEVGSVQGSVGLPVVLETADSAASRHEVEWLEQVEGVSRVDVVFVSCDEVPASSVTS